MFLCVPISQCRSIPSVRWETSTFETQWQTALTPSCAERCWPVRWHRGNGFNNTVSPEAWREFQAPCRCRSGLRRGAEPSDAEGSFAYRLLLTVLGRAAGWPLEQQWLPARKAWKRLPDDDDLYFGLLQDALPMRGVAGPAAVDRVVVTRRWRAPAARGLKKCTQGYYAGLLDETVETEQLFTASRADWAQNEAGLPGPPFAPRPPVRHNQFAWFACMAHPRQGDAAR